MLQAPLFRPFVRDGFVLERPADVLALVTFDRENSSRSSRLEIQRQIVQLVEPRSSFRIRESFA